MPIRYLVLLAQLVSPSLLLADEPLTSKKGLPEPYPEGIDFTKDIEPILKAHCLKCHNAEKAKGGLRLDDGKLALEGGDTGRVIIPKKSAESRLIHLVGGIDPETKMPPDKNLPLSNEQVAKLRKWIDLGAEWKATTTSSASRVKSTHWSFQPIQNPPIPTITNSSWARNGIDYFILAKLEEERITPSPEADKTTLIRRLYLDILGLPPSLTEVEEALSDRSPDWYEQLVDRLLASPHYGERWGRHWLDVARYADSDGYEKDTGRPFAWRYRNWVIDALNRDLPYDRFTIEQLAGDLLPKAILDQKIATGFHRNTLTNKEGGVDQEEFRVAAVKDRVETTAKVFLGITLGCAQCHDHKYDPFTQREYYQMLAYFNRDQEVDIDAPLSNEAEAIAEKMKAFEKKKAELTKSLENHQKQLSNLEGKWESNLKPEEIAKLPKDLQEVLKVERTKRTESQQKLLIDHYAKIDSKLVSLTKAISDHQKQLPTYSKAPTIALGKDRKTNVLIRGDFLRKGIEVYPGTLNVLPSSLTSLKQDRVAVPSRLDLANWIVHPENPLTRRVFVNWVWQKYFGRGLVATPEDFGTQGEKPSHPELLDWLATQLLEQRWTMKAIHRLIVMSATYRQSSRNRSELKDRDPLNVLLARQNRIRLEAEILRDNALAVSGLLTKSVGGPSIRPPQPSGISELTYANSAKWIESTGSAKYRRGIYIWFQRTSPYPTLMTFDSPDSNVCVVRRERSNTPLQALTLMNDVVFVECAQELGLRLSEMNGSIETRIDSVFRRCLARTPTDGERNRLLHLFEGFHALVKTKPEEASKLIGNRKGIANKIDAATWIVFVRTLLNLDEFVMRD